MVTLPSRMPAAFNATYTPIAAAGTTTQVRHLARLLAAQLVVWVTGAEKSGGADGDYNSSADEINQSNRALLMQLFNGGGEESRDGSAAEAAGTAASGEASARKLAGRVSWSKRPDV